MKDIPVPTPSRGQVLIKVAACGVCRTDLHLVDGELDGARYPIIPGHEIVGTVVALGADTIGLDVGQRVGVPWLGETCGACRDCRSGRENICDRALFTGLQLDGGYAEYTVANAEFCLPLPVSMPDTGVAPLLCAGIIGFRALRMTGAAQALGIYGFGAAAHIVAQIAVAEGRRVYALTRPGDREAQDFALSLGCLSAGDSDLSPPEPLDAAIVFAPVGALVPLALAGLRKGGTLVLAGIHMSEIPAMPYRMLWGERVIRSVANMTRRDGIEFMALAQRATPRTTTTTFALADAGEALTAMRAGRFVGAAVLVP